MAIHAHSRIDALQLGSVKITEEEGAALSQAGKNFNAAGKRNCFHEWQVEYRVRAQ
jgi:hypothetical protein